MKYKSADIEKPLETKPIVRKSVPSGETKIKKAVTTMTKPLTDIDKMFSDLATTSEFKRLIFKGITGKVHRGTTKELDSELSKILKKVRTN